MIFTPPVDWPPAKETAIVKPAHLVLRGRRILWILEVVRCVPVAMEGGEGIMTACVNGAGKKFNFPLRVTARDLYFCGKRPAPAKLLVPVLDPLEQQQTDFADLLDPHGLLLRFRDFVPAHSACYALLPFIPPYSRRLSMQLLFLSGTITGEMKLKREAVGQP